MAVGKINRKQDFRGVDGTRYEDFGVQQNITPEHDGWWAVEWEEDSTSPLAIAYMSQNGALISCMSGIGYRTGTCIVSCPVKAGLTYNCTVYRGHAKTSKVYY